MVIVVADPRDASKSKNPFWEFFDGFPCLSKSCYLQDILMAAKPLIEQRPAP